MAVLKQSLASVLVLSLGLASAAHAIEPREILMLRSKAVQGNAVAQYNLAKAFADPTSSNRDPAEAYVWFQIAADNGAKGDDFSKLVSTMSPAEIEDAKRRLEERRSQLTPTRPADDVSAETASADPAKLASELNETRATARELALKTQQLEDVAAERGRALQAALAENARLKSGGAPGAGADGQLVAVTADRDLVAKQLAEAQELLRKQSGLPERVSRAERDVELLRTQNASLSAQLKTAQQAAVGLAPASPASSSSDETKALQERLERTERVVAQLNKKNLELADLAQRTYSAENESARVQGKLAAAQKTIEELTARVEAAEAKAGAPAAAPDAAAEVEHLKKELADTQLKLESSLRSYALLQQEQAQAKTAQPAGAGDSASADAAALREKAETLEKQNAALAEQLAAAQSSTTSQKELDDTKDRLATALRSYGLLQKELDDTREKLTTAETDNAALRSQLTSALGDTQDRTKALNAIEQEIAQLRGSHATQGKEYAALQDQLRQSAAQNASLAEENAQLKTRIALLAPPPASTLASPLRPNTAAAQAAITLPPTLGGQPQRPAAAEAGARTHIVAPGDSLGKIARRYYGSSERWNDIYRANRNIIADPNRLPVGASLRIP